MTRTLKAASLFIFVSINRLLLSNLKTATDYEFEHGTTEEFRGRKVFSGASAEKIEALQDETMAQVHKLLARPESERQNAIKNIDTFATLANTKRSADVIEYKMRGDDPYKSAAKLELYTVGLHMYVVNESTNEVIQYGPRPFKEGEARITYNEIASLNQAKLQTIAENIAKEYSPVSLDNLTLKVNVKENEYTIRTFFRWEDTSTILDDKVHPFIQVGLSPGGDVVSYSNTLSL